MTPLTISAKAALFSVGMMLIAACAHDPYSVTVIDANDVQAGRSTSAYTVRKGDTLYSIAFRYGTTVYALARLNALQEPYVIYDGQQLKVKGRVSAAPPAQRAPPVAKPAVAAKATASPKVDGKPKPVVAPPVAAAPISPADTAWVLPSKAARGKGFVTGKHAHKGLDFMAPLGAPVVAARAGKVVYAGDGLKPYGLLIIIKHDQYYLSAYAYNQRLHVKEGDIVARGQKIASVGKKGDNSLLHFEIRKNGKPIDPATVLPAKG